MTVSAMSPHMRGMQWITAGLATATIAPNYIERSTLAVGYVTIRQEFGINATVIGVWLGNARPHWAVNKTPLSTSAAASEMAFAEISAA